MSPPALDSETVSAGRGQSEPTVTDERLAVKMRVSLGGERHHAPQPVTLSVKECAAAQGGAPRHDLAARACPGNRDNAAESNLIRPTIARSRSIGPAHGRQTAVSPTYPRMKAPGGDGPFRLLVAFTA